MPNKEIMDDRSSLKKYFQKFIFPYLKQHKKWVILAIIFAFLTILGSSLLQFTAGYLITSASLMPYNILVLYVPVVLVRTFGISQAVTRYFERLFGHNAVLKMLSNMRVKLYRILEPQALFIRSRFHTGDLLGTLADDIEHLQDVYIRTIFPTLAALLILVVSTVSVAIFDWKFALLLAFCLCVITVFYPFFSLFLLKKRQIRQKDLNSRLYTSLTDAVFGLNDWLISGKQERFIKQFVSDQEKLLQEEREQRQWNHSREWQLRVITGGIIILMGIWSAHMAQQGVIEPAYIAAFTLVVLPIIEGLIPVSQAIERIPTYQESFKRLEAIEQFHPKEVHRGKDVSIEKDKCEILVEDVTFFYEETNRPALKNMNLSIPSHGKIAVLGRSGAGKSTLLQVLLGELNPSNGKVCINGRESKLYGEHIFEVVSVLNQKPYLFATTVENNIRLGNKDATLQDIERVIKQVKLDKYIQSLPAGLQTQMDETGSRFSGGERQRIALARILLKNTPIVVLDEPTVGLDPLTERELIDTIFDVLKDKTVIWITHHLMGLDKMDEIVFLRDGEIFLKGSHEQLLQSSEYYRSLCALDLLM